MEQQALYSMSLIHVGKSEKISKNIRY